MLQTKSKNNLPKKLRIMGEYDSSGIWVMEPTLGFRHGMISHEALGLPDDLKNKFKKWIEIYNSALNNESFDVKEFDRTGLELAKELKLFLGPSVYVAYEPEESDFGQAMMEVVNRELAKESTVRILWLRFIDFINLNINHRLLGKDYDSLFGREMDIIMCRPDIAKELGLLKGKLTKTVVIK